MEFRIEELESYKIVVLMTHSTNALKKGMRDCYTFWKQIIKEGKNEALVPLISKKSFGLIVQ